MRAVPRYRKDQTISARIDGATNLCAWRCCGRCGAPDEGSDDL